MRFLKDYLAHNPHGKQTFASQSDFNPYDTPAGEEGSLLTEHRELSYSKSEPRRFTEQVNITYQVKDGFWRPTSWQLVKSDNKDVPRGDQALHLIASENP